MKTLEERLFEKIEVSETGCLLWLASTNPHGYGQFAVNRKLVLAHRFVYERVNGPIPKGLSLDHLCRVPPCVNPRHLEPVTHRENILRGKTFAAEYAARTHCKHGHEYTAENTMFTKGRNGRICKRCNFLRATITRRCDSCNGEYRAYKTRLNRGQGRFCSLKCFGQSIKKA